MRQKILNGVSHTTWKHPGTIRLGNLTGVQDESYHPAAYAFWACVGKYNLSKESQRADGDDSRSRDPISKDFTQM